MKTTIYLDYNATTPVDDAVLKAMLPWFTTHFGNPSSGHAYGQTAKKAIDGAREQVASLLGCAPDEIVFTSGGTESNNLAIRGECAAAPARRRHIVTSIVEHPASSRPCDRLEEEGFAVSRLPVDGTGQVRVEDARVSVMGQTALVTVMLANNETGTVMPIPQLAQMAHDSGAIIQTHAAQAAGKIPVRAYALGVDYFRSPAISSTRKEWGRSTFG